MPLRLLSSFSPFVFAQVVLHVGSRDNRRAKPSRSRQRDAEHPQSCKQSHKQLHPLPPEPHQAPHALHRCRPHGLPLQTQQLGPRCRAAPNCMTRISSPSARPTPRHGMEHAAGQNLPGLRQPNMWASGGVRWGAKEVGKESGQRGSLSRERGRKKHRSNKVLSFVWCLCSEKCHGLGRMWADFDQS